MRGASSNNREGEFKVSFGYHCNGQGDGSYILSDGYQTLQSPKIPRNSSFSCLSGAALSANATLANTNICNGVIGTEILPSWDSPNSFRKVPSSPSLNKLDILPSSLQRSMSYLSCSPSTPSPPEYDSYLKPMSAPSRNEGFLNTMEVQVAGGAAGEDRVQAVCSEENGWLFCSIYDGFNGRDAADFLAGTLYENIIYHTSSLDWESKQDDIVASGGLCLDGPAQYALVAGNNSYNHKDSNQYMSAKNVVCSKVKISSDSFRLEVLDGLQKALSETENDFLSMVEQEMEDRPDLVSVGSCVLVVLLHGTDLYTLNLGDSRAVLATHKAENGVNGYEQLKAVQLTDCHTVDNEFERTTLINEHPDDPATIHSGRVKGKLKVTRAFGVGYLKKRKLNDALMGILQVRNLISPPYISTEPSMNMHKISESDQFVIVASDGLFDFFDNDEAVKLVHSFMSSNPTGDPAKFLLEQLVERAADCAGFSLEELMNIPAGRRRKYHDDVTVIVVVLGTNQRTSKASTYM
ncbi:probable protein phosphatase 2C 40 [Mercurialis annua]|uniref:probable protein phosphatase 2C 40 n=1 Tax=Mercurialis annua TaxID=3986 RepID=UPI00215F53B3|nr:probable protein phosphatase 2C 40 [Mercurialis annua]XP_055960757.1 probable protein phosphatase 2C 40 [Mercurialis annua]